MNFKVLVALAALSVAQPASASIITFTSTGTLSSGFDQSGTFGTAGVDLAGAAYSMVAYFDTELGTYTQEPTHSNLSGGPELDGSPTPGYGTLTVNGVGVQLYGNGLSWLVALNGGTSSVFLLDRAVVGLVETTNQAFLSLNPTSGSLPNFHLQPGFHSDCTGVDECGGGFFFTSYELPNGVVNYYYDSGRFAPESFDVSGPVAVPEPATWAMMIVGFGLAGSALRRRRLEIA